MDKAVIQHERYVALLSELGVDVVEISAESGYPDGVFVEDAAVVLDEVAVITRMGCESRRGESKTVADALAHYRKLLFMDETGTLDGGDVMRVGKVLYVGHSGRSNDDGIDQFASLTSLYGYAVRPVVVSSCLHFKTGCTYLGDNTILLNPRWVPPYEFSDLDIIETDHAEPFAANSLTIGDTVLYPSCFPKTEAKLVSRGLNVRTLDISELQKAEAGLTCMSLIGDH